MSLDTFPAASSDDFPRKAVHSAAWFFRALSEVAKNDSVWVEETID
jgi:hypothetical protein